MAAKKKTSNIVVWILLGLLVIGLAGFGESSFLSSRITSIAQVGNEQVEANDYARALQGEVRQIQQQYGQALSIAQMQAMGIDAQVRARLVTEAALNSEARRIGISVGDENVSDAIATMREFRGAGGVFDPAMYRFALQNTGMTPSRFEDSIRREAARSILQAATVGGVVTPANLRGALIEHYAARRDVSVFALDESALETPLAAPNESEVRAYYDANPAPFTAPETRRITYAWLTPDMLLASTEVDEAAVRALYASRAEEYQRPERRLVERLVFPDTPAAEAAMARITDGSASFEALVAERGLTLDDADMGDVTLAQLGAAGEAVFALTEPGAVTGPFRSPVGPALFRMNAMLSASETPFEEVEDELRGQIAVERARRQIADQLDDFEDLLAGAATPEDLANETQMELGQIDWELGASDGIAAYDEFRSAAAAATTGQLLELRTLSDGGVFVIRLDEVVPPSPRPFEEVREQASTLARQAALEAALLARAESLAPQLAAEGVEAFSEASGLVPEGFEQITRIDTLTDLPAPLVERIHNTAEGAPFVMAAEGRAWLAMVTAVEPADEGDEQTARLVSLVDSEIGRGLAQDVHSYFARALEREAGIRFDQNAIELVHSNMR